MNKNLLIFILSSVIVLLGLTLFLLIWYLSDDDEQSVKLQLSEYELLQQEYCNEYVDVQIFKETEKSYFGVNHPGSDHYKELAEAGVFWERLGLYGYFGKKNEPRLEQNIEELDIKIMKAQMYGMQILLELPFFDPIDDMSSYRYMLSRIVERYDNDGVNDMPCLKYPIRYYMIGNEVCVKEFFNGTEEEYLDILKVSNEVIKGIDSNAVIVQGGMVSSVNNFFWDKLFEMNAAEYFDVLNIHEIHEGDSIRKIYRFDSDMEKLGFGNREKWVTEIQFENSNGQADRTTKEYANIMAKYLVYALAHDYTKLFIVNSKFPVLDDPGNPPFGDKSAMINSNNEKTEMYYAVQTVAKNLGKFEKIDIIKENIIEVIDENGNYMTVVKDGEYRFSIGDRTLYALWGDGPIPSYLNGRLKVIEIDGKEYDSNSTFLGLTEKLLILEKL